MLLAGAALLLFFAFVMVLWIFSPDVEALKTRNPGKTAMMRYREVQTRGKTGSRPRQNQEWVPLSRIAPVFIDAVLISEDDKFFKHGGFDFAGMRDALERNMRSGRIVGGGSTITQQLAKNLYLRPTRNPLRKIREAVIAFKIDRVLTKRRILELYLNVIEWGPGVYGAEAAARHYYGKSAADVTAEEAVRLASILPNPIRYQPENDRSRRMRMKRGTVAEILVKRNRMTEGELAALVRDLAAAAP